jgi:uncharacterized protein (DUF952 family)
MPDAIAYKILTPADVAALDAGNFEGAPIDIADGYIHLSTAGQLAETLDKHFAGRENLVIAAIGLAAFGPAVKWEISRGGALFPHLYARLGWASILAHAPLARAADGSVILPG